ncbi:hypothetical protein SEA_SCOOBYDOOBYDOO_112 [Mycobacterium phage ScoobyDoobyDoo]|nr:hypothetical protein SEA_SCOOBYDOOBYDOO_112 [Mycobacterium phage ScoobyDoobyDoo]
MSIVYPGTPETPAFDVFVVTTLPEDTPLSQAGPGGTRNLVESVEDQGDAIEALQHGAAYVDHDHSGDTGHIRKGGKLKQENTHEDCDVDSSTSAIHHTLGPGALQAAPGDHTHDYNSLPNIPFKICTSTTRPGMPQTGMIIYETDTKAFRQWALFQNNVAVDGLNVLYEFDTPSTLTIGGGGWTVSNNQSNATDKGRMATPDGKLVWIDEGSWTVVSWARRTGDNATTETDDQVFTWKTTTPVIESELPLTDGATNDYYFRVSSDEQSYIRLRTGYNYVKVFYTTDGRLQEKHLGTLDNINVAIAETEWRAEMVDREMRIYRAGQLLGTIKDTQNVTSKGADFRGYMIGMQAGQRGFGQTTPGAIDWFRVQDLRYYTSTNRWTLLPLGATPSVRLRQSKIQKILYTGTIIEFAEELEDNFGYFNKNASPTNVTVKEPGLYRIEASLQWDPQFAPDIAHIVVLINGLETTVRDSKFIKGNAATPGLSQTLSLSAPIRLAANDVVSIKAFYTAGPSLLDKIFSYFDSSSNVNSRLDLTYAGP